MKCKCIAVAILGMAITLSSTSTGMTAESTPQSGLGPNVESKTIIDFPLALQFKRPDTMAKTNFTPVKFSHVQHQKESCMTCHHTWDGKGKIQACTDAGCHNSTVRSDEHSYFHAFHNRSSERSCVGCHQRLNKDSKKKIRISPCANNACHIQEKSE